MDMEKKQSGGVPIANYVPIGTYVPYFANVPPAESIYGIPADVVGILKASQTLAIRQHVKLLPKNCCSCPPCVRQENTYSVYAGLDRNANAEFLRIDEVSDDWNRCCCAPYHPFRLEVRPYIPIPGQGNSDWDQMHGDMARDWNSFDLRKRSEALKEAYMRQPVLFSMIRDDGQRCCWKCPCKLLSTFVCCACCADGMHVYAGPLVDEPEKEKGRPYNIPTDKHLGSIIQPIFGGCYRPTLELRGERVGDQQEPYGKIEGPCCFGGWSEMCFDFKFMSSYYKSDSMAGDVGVITKLKPSNMAMGMAELFTESDFYQIEFNPSLDFTPAQKATLLAGQVFIDYMLFDGNTQKCTSDSNGTTCYFFYCMCIGALIPCSVTIPNNS